MGIFEYASSYRVILDEATRIRNLPRKERQDARKNLKPLAAAVVDAQEGTSLRSKIKIIDATMKQNDPSVRVVTRATWEIGKVAVAEKIFRRKRKQGLP
jgi:hypothetical protein